MLHEEGDRICPVQGPDISGKPLWNLTQGSNKPGYLEGKGGPGMSGKRI
jgi:hypothetical protein